jgi:hypothetical protein
VKARREGDEDYREPDLPEGVRADWLCAVDQEWGLYDLLGVREEDVPPRCQPVPESLKVPLYSAQSYPPAMALARERVHGDDEKALSREEFVARYIELLENELRAQPKSSYFLARGRVPHFIGYQSTGQYVWIVAWDKKAGRVGWVTGDHFVYFDPVDEFEIEPTLLERLPIVEGQSVASG